MFAPWKILPAAFLLLALPAQAIEKAGMPDLIQQESSCVPTSTAQLLIWFGHHGYPKLLLPGSSEDDINLNIVHQVIVDVATNYEEGTWMRTVPDGIRRYVNEAGYDCDVEYRGLTEDTGLGAVNSFTPDWLKDNDDPKKGFILVLEYCHYDSSSDTYTSGFSAGHVVTLVAALPGILVIQDPAHEEGEVGRKIVTPTVLTSGALVNQSYNFPVSNLLKIEGSALYAPEDADILVIGAVCVTMRGKLGDVLAAGDDSSGKVATDSAPPAAGTWLAWFARLLWGK